MQRHGIILMYILQILFVSVEENILWESLLLGVRRDSIHVLESFACRLIV